ncbi:MAG: hypothetical protein AAGF06_04455 [Pseudomonadota bacterium]
MNKTSLRYKLVSSLGAFALWGGWSFYINNKVSYKDGVVSGILQGISSAFVTLMLVYLVTFYANQFTRKQMKITLTPVLSVTTTGLLVVFAHLLVGTPSIFWTVFPMIITGYFFSLFTVLAITRE